MKEFVDWEPKKSDRFVVKFKEPFQIAEYVIHHVSNLVWKDGKWEKITFRMYDPISPSTSQALREGMNILRTRDNKEIGVTINYLGPVGDDVGQATITGGITYIDFGQLNFGNNDDIIITLELDPTSVIINY